MYTETDRDGPELTETDRNGPKRTFVDTETDFLDTETDFSGYRNGLFGYKIVIRGAYYRSSAQSNQEVFLFIRLRGNVVCKVEKSQC